MTDLFENDLFSNIEVSTVRPPLGGVPEAALKSFSWGTKELKAIDQPSAHNRPGWRDALMVSTSLQEIGDRTQRPTTEIVVSQEINGELYVGVDGLDHSFLVAELKAQGYALESSKILSLNSEFHVERFARRS
jgi:hypothetical protein